MSERKNYSKNRISDLSQIKSDVEVEVFHKNGGSVIYDNIHYPTRFCDTVFENDSSAIKVIIRKIGDPSFERTIVRDGIS
jgi:hypothetical protein